ncbi:MAG: type IV toxin-antitoxin system AbiEi family antitoxin domain-containing protein [Rothia sp. (in: high G+C Gram-positive bacteria)]|uniref:type IV toxin-antitoxin system AbiEi family antitoxin domain-containing protein n=1 Tax=Rothia sp. (in: high G+C Gram-positive bacteria) TaxID=1885016 RepID=UPI0026DC5717|nr:type IV toxin-antitoxin system AbiEi family antitoxin domain-containing protein [Rothia sp. (in: high G+C Gram-positive bacteria)]MDO4884905.1 type IV toxin-antitoxin system AbiEi family antitoxin domain-containing protein [Rothia sp. (in: high G+C Gram-positive bacteria)]
MGWLDVEKLASEQYGLFTSAQVDAHGVSRATLHRKARQGFVQQVRRGVYVLVSARWDIHRDLRAAWLSLEPQVSAGERLWDSPQFLVASAAAAEVYGVGDFYVQQYEFYTRERKQVSFEDIRLSHRQDMPAEATVVEGLPLVPPTRLIYDFLREGRDLEKVSLILQELIQKGYEIHWSDVVAAVRKYSSRIYGSPASWVMGELLKTRVETQASAHPALDSYLESGEKLKLESVE